MEMIKWNRNVLNESYCYLYNSGDTCIVSDREVIFSYQDNFPNEGFVDVWIVVISSYYFIWPYTRSR